MQNYNNNSNQLSKPNHYSQTKCMIQDQQQLLIKFMSQITIIAILQKIRSICKECKLETIPERIVADTGTLNLQNYIKTLDNIRTEFIKYRNLEQEYMKLENLLQKQEMQIRKRVSVQQQLKLYTDTLKIQVEDLEKEKIDLLENSKAYIKELKKTNETLFAQLHVHTNKKGKSKSKSKENSPQKTQKSKNNKSLSHYKPRHDKSIRQIIKTQYIDRDRSNSANRKKPKKQAKFGVYSTISAHDKEYQDYVKTFQVVGNANSGKKQKITGSRKKNKHVFSNFTLLNFLDSSNKKMKRQQKQGPHITKSPGKLDKKKQDSRIRSQNTNKMLWNQKKANKSIFSVSSMEPNLNSKKETI